MASLTSRLNGGQTMIIDRIENQIVICEDENGQTIELPIDMFIQPIQDGDIIAKNQEYLYETDKEETEKRKKNIEDRFNSLFN
jgi:hypothetical protein